MGEFDKFVQEGRDCFMVRFTVPDWRSALLDGSQILYADLVPAHMEKLAAASRSRTEAERTRILRSVLRCLRTAARYILPAAESQNIADDIAIWWFYEYEAGRGEDHIEPAWREKIEMRAEVRLEPWRPKGLVRASKAQRRARR